MSTAEQLGETWTDDILGTWRQVFDAACKEAGWTPTWVLDPDHGWLVAGVPPDMSTPDPLVEALARTILRHQLGCNQPAEPPAWMIAAAAEIAAAIRGDGLPLSILCPNCHAPDLEDITEALPEAGQ